MNTSVPKADPLTRLNTVQPGMAKVRTTVNRVEPTADPDDDAEMLRLIEKAIRRCGVSQEACAAFGRVKPSQLSGTLNGHGNFNVRWLWKFPPEFWMEFLPILRAAKEPSEEARRQRRRELLIMAIELLLSEAA